MTERQKYEVLNGLNWGTTRKEPGDVCDDIPESSLYWLLEQGHIREYDPDNTLALPFAEGPSNDELVAEEASVEAEFVEVGPVPDDQPLVEPVVVVLEHEPSADVEVE